MSSPAADKFPVPDWLVRELFPFDPHWFEYGGHRIHYVDEGSGRPLLLLHGNPTWSFLWRKVIVELRDDFRCVAPDYPGFGLSEAAAGYGFTPREHAGVIAALIEDLDLNGVLLAGHDWGGPIGLFCACRFPDRFAGLVLTDTFGFPLDESLSVRLFSKFWGSPLGGLLVHRLNAFTNWALPAGTSEPLAPEVMQHYRAPFPTPESRRPTRVFPRQLLDGREFLAEVEHCLEDELSDIPALLLWGEDDPVIGGQELHRFEKLLEHSTSYFLIGASHYTPEDAPILLAGEIRSWLAEEGLI